MQSYHIFKHRNNFDFPSGLRIAWKQGKGRTFRGPALLGYPASRKTAFKRRSRADCVAADRSGTSCLDLIRRDQNPGCARRPTGDGPRAHSRTPLAPPAPRDTRALQPTVPMPRRHRASLPTYRPEPTRKRANAGSLHVGQQTSMGQLAALLPGTRDLIGAPEDHRGLAGGPINANPTGPVPARQQAASVCAQGTYGARCDCVRKHPTPQG